ncbi:MAG: diguanylate cyclase [Pseudomonas sp.]
MSVYRFTLEEMTSEWQLRLDSFPPSIRQLTAQTAERHKVDLANHFYSAMLEHREAAQFLSHDEVKTRLSGSMANWIANLYAGEDIAAIQSSIAHQSKIGEVHARISIPVHLVLRGARLLKQQLTITLHKEQSAPQAAQAGAFASTLIDLAMEIMSQAYATSHDRNSRAEESYRLFAVTQNIASEKEKQRAALLDWENQLMFDVAMNMTADQLPRLSASEFGLWFRHKGAHGFEGAVETGLILHTISQIDNVILPLFARRHTESEQQNSMQLLRDLREQAKSIAYHLDLLFEQNNELEAGRDVLTRLLNRKYLSVVLNRQITYARDTSSSFAVLSIDLDHFKLINDTHGHEAGDLVLQQFASLMLNKSRAGDYLFRMGGEEFLMIMVDVNENKAARAAEKIRQLIAAETFRLPQDMTLQLSASLGLALFNGHPDYQHLLRRSDAALYEAKHAGRNRVVIASS